MNNRLLKCNSGYELAMREPTKLVALTDELMIDFANTFMEKLQGLSGAVLRIKLAENHPRTDREAWSMEIYSRLTTPKVSVRYYTDVSQRFSSRYKTILGVGDLYVRLYLSEAWQDKACAEGEAPVDFTQRIVALMTEIFVEKVNWFACPFPS